MKRLTKYLLGTTMAVALIVSAVLAAAWVAGTTDGTRWFLTTVPRFAGVRFSAQKVDGRLLDNLHLTGVRIDLTQQKLELDRLELAWQPLHLLSGTVAISELSLLGVRIRDNAPAARTTDLSWPRVSGIAAHLDGTITRLRLDGLSYRHLDEQPVVVNTISTGVVWRDRRLSLSELSGDTPDGRVTGNISAGFHRPSLTADVTIAPSHPVAGMDRLSLVISSLPGRRSAPFVGNITVAGRSGSRKLLELTGEVAMARQAFNLKRFRLTRPGRRGMVTAEGSVDCTARESVLTLQVKAADLDLAPELKLPTDLSGTLTFTGSPADYRGTFAVANKGRGWHAAAVSGSYRGTGTGMKLAPFTGSIIDGTLGGHLDLDWSEGLTLTGALHARKLNPARLAPDWQGVANFDAAGSLAWSGHAPVRGELSGDILESRLHGQELTGTVRARFSGADLTLDRLALQGKGFAIQASGNLNRRLSLAADISDASLLVPGAAGTLKADGWVRRSNGQLTGAVTGKGHDLAAGGIRIAAAELTARLEEGTGSPFKVSATIRQAVYDRYKADVVAVTVGGTEQHHTVTATLRSAGARALLTFSGGYDSGTWKGEITRFEGADHSGPWKLAAPAAVAVSAAKISLAPLLLKGAGTERLEAAVLLDRQPLKGQLRAHWNGVNLARANPYLHDEKFTGRSDGTIRLEFGPGERLSLNGNAAARGTVSAHDHSVTVTQGILTFAGNEQGLRVEMELKTASGGSLKGTFSSSAPLRRVMPDRGEFTAELSGIDLALFQPWLPRDVGLAGVLSGRATGALLPGQHLELEGTAALSGGEIHWARPGGELDFSLRKGDFSWVWRKETLSGTVAVTMAEYGQARGSFQLPVPASLPVAVRPQGALRVALTGQVREKGIITALFPGLVQESHGELAVDLKAGGSWETPRVEGILNLSKAGAYLPTAGIRVKDVQLTAHLGKDLIRIDTFRAVSGPGHLEGTALITLSGLQMTGYRGTITGESFQTVFFPELQIRSTPKLTFEGTPAKLTVRGELRLPELRIVGEQSKTVIRPSSDVIVEGRSLPPEKTHHLALNIQVRVLLGDQVFVKMAGIDAQLGGAMDLSLLDLDRITSKGEITVTKGHYRAYGVNLDIVRGRLFYAGGPIDRPTLDFLAQRTIGDVRAGVAVGGTLQNPVTRLYSEPAMPDVDILAYIVLGHPLGSNTAQASLLAQAAGQLLTTGQSESLQEQLKFRIGLSTLEVKEGVGGTTSHMGYKPMTVTPPGTVPAAQQPGITETMMTVGKFLTPQLYLSYGRSLFTGTNLFTLRYDIYKKWQVESQVGSESGVDLYYKLEFN